MKKIFSIAVILLAVIMVWQGCKKKEETGEIYGTVTDYATGEPVKNANVKLRPTGTTIQTGSDGTYSFQDIKTGEYSLSLSKAEYEDLDDDYVISVSAGKRESRDVQMKKQVALLRITDMNGNDITTLDFGSEMADLSRLFNIFNDSHSSLDWDITTTANWIKSVSATNGTLSAGATKGIIVVIDRSKLQQGTNTTTLHITSNNGNKQLTITATRTDVNTLEATAVSDSSAILHGQINTDILYSERGFYYGTNHNLTQKVVVEGNGTGAFSTQITGLSEGTTYYFKAYCIYNGVYLYGEEKSFIKVPSFEFNGHTYMVAPDPRTTMIWSTAKAYCEGLTLYGFSDWKMPTKEELMQMFTNRASIGGFVNGEYWSNTSDGSSWHYYIDFSNGVNNSHSNSFYCWVRPIRVAQ